MIFFYRYKTPYCHSELSCTHYKYKTGKIFNYKLFYNITSPLVSTKTSNKIETSKKNANSSTIEDINVDNLIFAIPIVSLAMNFYFIKNEIR